MKKFIIPIVLINYLVSSPNINTKKDTHKKIKQISKKKSNPENNNQKIINFLRKGDRIEMLKIEIEELESQLQKIKQNKDNSNAVKILEQTIISLKRNLSESEKK